MTSSFSMRPGSDADLAGIAALARTVPPATRHLVDLPWRLSSPALTSGVDARCCVAPDGSLLGFAAWQAPWAALDFLIHPGPDAASVEDALFTWAEDRFRALDRERGRPLPYWVEAREDDADRLALAARHGYTLDDDFEYTGLERPLTEAISEPAPAHGYSIRPLAGAADVDAYVALHRAAFDSKTMTSEWRRRTLRMPSYRPDLDLVVVAPEGDLAGFCVGWLDTQRRVGQVEPLGIHPTHQRRGLGRALLDAIARRFAAHGAATALVETESVRSPAQGLYAAAGFRPEHRVLRKGKYSTS
jgi:ribosomal protein S18 acetylase RimI-like enzyme